MTGFLVGEVGRSSSVWGLSSSFSRIEASLSSEKVRDVSERHGVMGSVISPSSGPSMDSSFSSISPSASKRLLVGVRGLGGCGGDFCIGGDGGVPGFLRTLRGFAGVQAE